MPSLYINSYLGSVTVSCRLHYIHKWQCNIPRRTERRSFRTKCNNNKEIFR